MADYTLAAPPTSPIPQPAPPTVRDASPDLALFDVALPALVALAGAGAPAAVLHLALAHAMRARGLPRWRVADTLLVSPLLFLALLTAFGALAHAVARAAAASAAAVPVNQAHLAGSLAVAAGAFVAAGFGARAVGKLY